MKPLLFWLLSFVFLITFSLNAQDVSIASSIYFQNRAKEDAAYEQSVKFKDTSDEEDFWKDQKGYEKDLKKKNKEAYLVYMKSKKEAYAKHSKHCSDACEHNKNFYSHTYSYQSYERTYYPRRLVMGAQLRVDTPKLSLGNF
ncbi:hypothetical protein [Croceivirga lutea]|uniref:hypothetical protein n=1 Tax=Croceivirga lutea TaxID=1775167 RepID=UPI00163A3F53|nr:hypothetical protein [Croceivirga lutea]